MNYRTLGIMSLVALAATAVKGQAKVDLSLHKSQFVTVAPDVKLEVLDWGGTGRAIVFLAGLGNGAHVFDKFAPKFIGSYHVYGITRRGFGLSSKPISTIGNYAADRLGDDVLAVIDKLALSRPVLVGHSLAGEELSSIGSRYPNKVAGLIYLDAANPYAYYDSAHGDLILDTIDAKNRIDALLAGAVQNRLFIGEILASLSQLEKDLQQSAKYAASLPDPPAPPGPPPPIIMAIVMGAKKYVEINAPILAIFACPHNLDAFAGNDPHAKAVMIARDLSLCSIQANAVEHGIPNATVVRLRNADHYVFNSNESAVLGEMNTFLSKLP